MENRTKEVKTYDKLDKENRPPKSDKVRREKVDKRWKRWIKAESWKSWVNAQGCMLTGVCKKVALGSIDNGKDGKK